MRDLITLVEAAFTDAKWVRWWANAKTGQLVPVPGHLDHDAFLHEHLDDFAPEFDGDLEDDADRDRLLYEVYQDGWQTALYSYASEALYLKGEEKYLKQLHKFAKNIARKYQVDKLALDFVGPDGVTPTRSGMLIGDQIRTFLGKGVLPF